MSKKPKPENRIWAYWRVLLDERVRTYVVVTAAALLVIFVAQLMSGSLIAGAVPFAIGLTALGLRWVGMPVVCVLSVAYFQALPFGIPINGGFPIDARQTHFRIQDLLLVMAVVVYLIAQYRVYSLAHMAVPDERQLRYQRGDKPDLRDPALISEQEVPQLMVAAAAVVIAGQMIWLGLSEVVLDFRQLPPIRPRQAGMFGSVEGAMPPQASRWLLFVLSFGVLVFVTRLAFWYWKLRTLNRAEAQMILADAGWAEMRREAARQETWRAWGKYRARRLLPKPKLKRRPSDPVKPWVGAAIFRSCLIMVIAGVIAILLVAFGVWLLDSRRR
ncbi:hypothetical protein [Limnoglobus roseus]|uniref:Uncharacterized protein n=1 Tax=Limnoglobus roseus TaxID=2598579 RepID=A0A5C1A5E8_9BACT|nr:hypothetical protein [Limnoglobus roseus]QEL13900.1 hypothetical protein PX52LOC_00758 [Limnoglobus roseus]